MTRVLLAIAAAILVFAAIQAGSCGPDSESEIVRTPVAELGCDELVCTLLVWDASEVRVYDDVDLFYHRWSDDQGYLDDRRLTYRFPLPPSGIVIAEACNPQGMCTTAEYFKD